MSGSGDGDLRVEGDLSRVRLVGSEMTGGSLTICGPAGAHVGQRMRGGRIIVEGDVGDWAGAELRGGLLVIRGSAGRRLGGAYHGQRTGMCGGEIVVYGDAGIEAGTGLRRRTISIGAGPPASSAFGCWPGRSSPSAASGLGRARACAVDRSSRCVP